MTKKALNHKILGKIISARYDIRTLEMDSFDEESREKVYKEYCNVYDEKRDYERILIAYSLALSKEGQIKGDYWLKEAKLTDGTSIEKIVEKIYEIKPNLDDVGKEIKDFKKSLSTQIQNTLFQFYMEKYCSADTNHRNLKKAYDILRGEGKTIDDLVDLVSDECHSLKDEEIKQFTGGEVDLLNKKIGKNAINALTKTYDNSKCVSLAIQLYKSQNVGFFKEAVIMGCENDKNFLVELFKGLYGQPIKKSGGGIYHLTADDLVKIYRCVYPKNSKVRPIYAIKNGISCYYQFDMLKQNYNEFSRKSLKNIEKNEKGKKYKRLLKKAEKEEYAIYKEYNLMKADMFLAKKTKSLANKIIKNLLKSSFKNEITGKKEKFDLFKFETFFYDFVESLLSLKKPNGQDTDNCFEKEIYITTMLEKFPMLKFWHGRPDLDYLGLLMKKNHMAFSYSQIGDFSGAGMKSGEIHIYNGSGNFTGMFAKGGKIIVDNHVQDCCAFGAKKLSVEADIVGQYALSFAKNVKFNAVQVNDVIGFRSKGCNISIEHKAGIFDEDLVKSDLTYRGKKMTHGKRVKRLAYSTLPLLIFGGFVLHGVGDIDPIALLSLGLGAGSGLGAYVTRRGDLKRIKKHNHQIFKK